MTETTPENPVVATDDGFDPQTDEPMTAEIRRTLNERGIEWSHVNEHVTYAYLEDRAIEYRDIGRGRGISVRVLFPRPILNGTVWLTPEQAIEVSLGHLEPADEKKEST